MKRTVIQDITDALGISRTSVWKALNNKEGISDSLKQKIVDKAQELNYPFVYGGQKEYATAGKDVQLNIAVAVCRPETSVFWGSIIHQISIVLEEQNANLIYVSLPFSPDEEYVLPKSLSDQSIDGIIILNIYNENLTRLLSCLDVPKVFFDCATAFEFKDLKGDILLTENKNSMFLLTENLINKGCRKLAFIGDIAYAKTNMERYEGFCHAVEAKGLQLYPHLSMTGAIGVDTYKEEINDFIEGLSEWPDAFVCVNDFIACIVLQILYEKNIPVPERVKVTGFDGNRESPFANGLATVQVPNADIGCRLAWQILYRIKYPCNQYEAIYISTSPFFDF